MSSMQPPSDMKAFNEKVISEFRANGGKLTGPMAATNPMLLTTRGARTGAERTVVIGFRKFGDGYAVIASNNAAPTAPHWYFNLMKDPEATAEVGAEKFRVRARVAEGEERDQAAAIIDYLPGQQAKAKREIPVLILERI